jgi:hypothetical protein
VALSEAIDVLHWMKRNTSYRRIRMVIETASNSPAFSSSLISLLPTT